MALALVLAALAYGRQVQPVPYSELAGPAFVNTRVDWLYPAAYPSIREVDFKNLALRSFDAAGKPRDEVQLSNGSRKWGDGTFREEVGLDSVEYLTPVGAKGAEFALMVFRWISVSGEDTCLRSGEEDIGGPISALPAGRCSLLRVGDGCHRPEVERERV